MMYDKPFYKEYAIRLTLLGYRVMKRFKDDIYKPVKPAVFVDSYSELIQFVENTHE